MSEEAIDKEDTETSSGSALVRPLPGGMTRFRQDLDGIIDRYENNSDVSDDVQRGQQQDSSDIEDDTHFAQAVKSFDEDSLRNMAFNNGLYIVRYKFKQSGTAQFVLRRLMSLDRKRLSLPVDIIDAWLVPNAPSYHVHLLLDPNPSPATTISPYTPPSPKDPLHVILSHVDDFIGKQFVTIDVNSRYTIKDFNERLAALRHRKSHRQNLNRKWVEIRGGIFNGDIGFAVQGDLYYHVFVLPRICPQDSTTEFRQVDSSSAKRVALDVEFEPPRKRRTPIIHPSSKSHSRPAVRLFRSYGLTRESRHSCSFPEISHVDNQPAASARSLCTHESFIDYPQLWFDGDLQLLRIHVNRLKPALTILSRHRDLFIQSANTHIDKTTLPLPLEWVFRIGDVVEDLSKPSQPNIVGSSATILDIQPRLISIGINHGDQTVEVARSPLKLLKIFHLGDFVEVCHADAVIRSGSVVGIGRKSLDLFTQIEVDNTVSTEIISVHKNMCQTIEQRMVPIESTSNHQHDTANPKLAPSTAVHKYYTGKVPWLGADIVITVGQFKGRKANVEDVDLDDNDETGLTIMARLYGSLNNHVVDTKYSYMHIADERTGWPLRVVYPLSESQRQRGFMGNVQYFELEQSIAWFTRIEVRPGPSISPVNDGADSDSAHWLTLPCLSDHKVEVFWTQSSAKRPRSFTVQQVKIGSEVAIYQCGGGENMGKRISPWNLRPKHPGHKADKDKRWMCINGQHKGTFWRGLQYHKSSKEWAVFQVIPHVNIADEDAKLQACINDEDLVVIADSQRTRLLNAEYATRRVGSREEITDPFLINEDDVAH